MRKIGHIAIIALSVAAALMTGCNRNGKQSSENPSGIVVTTGSSEASVSSATLRGAIIGDTSAVTEAGFTYGPTEEMALNTTAAINGSSITATVSGLEKELTYYYRAYAVAGGETLTGSVRSFKTTSDPDKLEGISWIELPEYTAGTTRIAKAYFCEMKDGKTGRNYSILYDTENALALWVAFPMNNSTHLGSNSSSASWKYDDSGDIPRSVQPNMRDGSYTEKEYQRGHQIARADRTGTAEALRQTYMATNSTPQYSSFNGGVWGSLESAIRDNVAKHADTPSQDTLYIVTGPIMADSPSKTAHDKDGKECPVPDGYFKVVLWSKYNGEGQARSYDSIGFLFADQFDAKSKYTEHETSVAEVERQTGYSFFGNLGLPAPQMSAVKSTSSWSSFTNRTTSP